LDPIEPAARDRGRGRAGLAAVLAVTCLTTAACGIHPATAGRDPGTLVVDTANSPSTLDPGNSTPG
jgi:peptide/nickel transport system substrate-binding protein